MQVDYEPLEAGVIGIKLNRPEKLNAFSPALENEFLDAIRRACADESVRVVIFSGAGRGFSGGCPSGSSHSGRASPIAPSIAIQFSSSPPVLPAATMRRSVARRSRRDGSSSATAPLALATARRTRRRISVP